MSNQALAVMNAGAIALSMTSREIAELTGKQHDNVLRDIRNLGSVLRVEETPYTHPQNGQQYIECRLSKRDCLILVSGYNADLRARIIDRWIELEAVATTPALPDFTNPAIAARAWAEQFEAKLALSAQIAADAPKVAFAEAIRSIDGVCHIEKLAKTLGYGRNKFFKRLRDDTILMRSNLPYQKYIDREYFTVIEQEPYTDKEGITHPTFTAMVTGAGQVFLARKYSPAALGHAR